MGPIVEVVPPLTKRFLALAAHVRGCRQVVSSARDWGLGFRAGQRKSTPQVQDLGLTMSWSSIPSSYCLGSLLSFFWSISSSPPRIEALSLGFIAQGYPKPQTPKS